MNCLSDEAVGKIKQIIAQIKTDALMCVLIMGYTVKGIPKPLT